MCFIGELIGFQTRGVELMMGTQNYTHHIVLSAVHAERQPGHYRLPDPRCPATPTGEEEERRD